MEPEDLPMSTMFLYNPGSFSGSRRGFRRVPGRAVQGVLEVEQT